MKIVSHFLTELQLEVIKKLVDKKFYPNRSEAIRSLINDGLLDKIKLISKNDKEYLEYFNTIYKNEEVEE